MPQFTFYAQPNFNLGEVTRVLAQLGLNEEQQCGPNERHLIVRVTIELVGQTEPPKRCDDWIDRLIDDGDQ